jgi:hypothetical protein
VSVPPFDSGSPDLGMNAGLTSWCLNSDASGAEPKDENDTATAILKKKKKPNQLMYVLDLFRNLPLNTT